MKTKILYLIISLTICSCSHLKNLDSDTSKKYELVRNYIMSDSVAADFLNEQGANISSPFDVRVENNVYPPSIADFESYAVKHNINLKLNDHVYPYNDSLMLKLITLEQGLYFDPYPVRNLNNLTTDRNAKALIAFSPVYKDYLTVRLYYYILDVLIFSPLPWQGLELNYLFLFEGDKIKNVLHSIGHLE